MKWNGGGEGQAGGRIWKMSHSETTKESPDGVPFFPSATNSEEKGGGVQDILWTIRVELVLPHAMADWRFESTV